MKKNILFMHQNFPGQYRELAPILSKIDKYNVSSLSAVDQGIKGIKHYNYNLTLGNGPKTHRLALEYETKMIRAEASALRCLGLSKSGYSPDIIIAHPGWGEGLFIKEIWPNVKVLNFFEFYYNTSNSDVDFDVDDNQSSLSPFEMSTKLVSRNIPLVMSFIQSDQIVCPTKFQASTAPEIFSKKINIIHDGVDTEKLKRDDTAFIEVNNEPDTDSVKGEGVRLTKKDKIITFVNRNLEPYRGYHIFMRALPDILEKHPDAYVLIIGGNEVSYGATPANGQSYKDIYYNEVKHLIHDKRKQIKFLGNVPYNSLISMLAISTAHVYLTYPFVLSWSMLEAMAMESLVIGSKTPPVEEIISHNKNGLLVDFHDIKGLSNTVNNVLDNRDDYEEIRKNGRQTIVENYDLKSVCLPEHLKLIESLE